MDAESWTALAAVATGMSAVATGIAAGVTAWMARATKQVAVETGREADQTARQLEIAYLALQADTRPWLRPGGSVRVTDVDGMSDSERLYSSGGAPGEIWVTMTIENIGRGLAVLPPFSCELRASGRSEGDVIAPVGAADQPLLATGEGTNIVFRVNKALASGAFRDFRTATGQDRSIDGELFIDVVTTDSAGGQRARMIVQLAADSKKHWAVGRVEYLDDTTKTEILSTHVRPY